MTRKTGTTISEEIQLKRLEADKVIKNNVILGIGAGLIPTALIDIAAITAIELKMIGELARVYQFSFPKKLAAYKVLISLIGGLGPVYFSGKFYSTFKTVPFVGHVLSASMLSITGGASVYAVGWIFRKHFESGGVFLSSENSVLRSFFQEKYQEGRKMIPQMAGVNSSP